MKAFHFAALPALALAGLALTAASPAAAKDASVEARLEKKQIKYELDEDGDYKLGISWSNEGRSQLVFVRGTTETVGGLTVREVFSAAAFVEKHDINGSRALALLEASGQTKLGSWEIRGGVLYFVAKVFDKVNADELEAVISIVAEAADNKEIELAGGTDDL
jgi:hypothetical protein